MDELPEYPWLDGRVTLRLTSSLRSVCSGCSAIINAVSIIWRFVHVLDIERPGIVIAAYGTLAAAQVCKVGR